MSYTSAIDRADRRAASTTRPLSLEHLLLPLASLIAAAAIGSAYAGNRHAAALRQPAVAAPITLSAIGDAAALEPALAVAYPQPADRRFAARALAAFVVSRRDAGRPLANVGALAEATASAADIDADRLLVDIADRLRSARERARAAGTPPPTSLPILTSDRLAAAKPFLAVRTPDAASRLTWLYAGLIVAAFYAIVVVWMASGVRGDLPLLAAVHLLTGLGFALLVSRVDPLRDTLLFTRYTAGVVCGCAALGVASLVDVRKFAFLRLSYLPLAAALLLSLLLIVFGDGPGASRARVNLGPVQPIEAIRLLLVWFLAGFFAERWELLRQLRSRALGDRVLPQWLHLPRPEHVVPLALGVGAALLLFVVQRDLGPALFLTCVFTALYAVARARVVLPLAGAAIVAAGFAAGYRLQISETLTARVRMWQSPWDNSVRGGDQLAQSLWAVASGGWHGTGLGFGDTRYLPAGHTDLVLSAIGEELGLAGLLAVGALYVFVAIRGFRIARRASSDYGFFLATAVTLFLIVPVVMMAAGVFGAMPLTGIVTPFLSYGGSAMVANLAGIGLLMAIASRESRAYDVTPFARPVQCLAGVLAAAALAVVAVVSNTAVLHADAVLVRPHLGLQADGVRRFQYNPRVIDAVRRLPRGTIYDRRGLPLATADAAVSGRAAAEYAKAGIVLRDRCPAAADRCYPLGAATFHLLGDAARRTNWSAPNSSYIERDADDRLRGFDDRAVAVQAADASAGTPGQVDRLVRRDYSDLLPLVRHRYEPDHPAVRALLTRPRDVRLTIDAPLQARLSAILTSFAARSKSGHAAGIVIDAATGDLLAVDSYPAPSPAAAAPLDPDALIDRARYGLYPPGSTFKLITAAAALDQQLAGGDLRFTCAALPDGRVGARIPGWNRPVRDDVLDTRPHGTLGLHDGLVHSCNAYFAQLAVRVGTRALRDTAARAGIAATPAASLSRLRDTLPQAGYGQGDVLASPLRMARVAAAFARGGLLPDVSWDAARARGTAPTQRLASAEASTLIAQYMRDAVVSGTGRALRGHPLRIAGKTGTAEVAGAASHSWFVGFAPFEASPGARTIAFAVIVENAGYGAAAAAPLAGEVVTAAADLGLIK